MDNEFRHIIVKDVSPAPDDPKSEVFYYESEEEMREAARRDFDIANNGMRVHMYVELKAV